MPPKKRLITNITPIDTTALTPMNTCQQLIIKPNKIENYQLINADPDKYVSSFLSKTEDLKKLVERAAYLYYNSEESGLTDNSFDALEYHLKKRE